MSIANRFVEGIIIYVITKIIFATCVYILKYINEYECD